MVKLPQISRRKSSAKLNPCTRMDAIPPNNLESNEAFHYKNYTRIGVQPNN